MFKLVFEDDFTNGIDLEKWMYRIGFPGVYCEAIDPIIDDNNNLVLRFEANIPNTITPHCKTSQVRTPLAIAEQGYYEFRMRPPQHPGWWIAFYIWPNNIGNGRSTEFDILEHFCNNPDCNYTRSNYVLHWYADGPESQTQWTNPHDYTDEGKDWMTVGGEWTPDGYAWFINGQKKAYINVADGTNRPGLHKGTMHGSPAVPTDGEPGALIMHATYGGWGGPKPTFHYKDSVLIDYVKYYKYIRDIDD